MSNPATQWAAAPVTMATLAVAVRDPAGRALAAVQAVAAARAVVVRVAARADARTEMSMAKQEPAKQQPRNKEPVSQGGPLGVSDTEDREKAIKDGALTTTRAAVTQGPSS